MTDNDYSSFIIYNTTEIITEQNERKLTKSAVFNTELFLYILIGLFGLTGNVLVLIVMLKNATMRKSIFNKLLIYQSLLDSLASLFVIIQAYIPYGMILKGHSGDLVCRLWMTKFTMWGFFLASNFNLVILTLERYVNLIHPLLYKRSVSSCKVYAAMLVTTLLCLVFVLTRDYNTSGLSQKGICLPLSLFKSRVSFRAVVLLSATVQFYLPLFIMLIAYAHIIVYLLAKVKSGFAQSPGGGTRNERLQKATYNILKTMLTVCLLFFICWVGNSTAVVLLAFDLVEPFFTHPLYHLSTYLCFFNCAVNPVIYSLQYKDFQEAAKSLFCKPRGSPLQAQSSHKSNETTSTG